MGQVTIPTPPVYESNDGNPWAIQLLVAGTGTFVVDCSAGGCVDAGSTTMRHDLAEDFGWVTVWSIPCGSCEDVGVQPPVRVGTDDASSVLQIADIRAQTPFENLGCE